MSILLSLPGGDVPVNGTQDVLAEFPSPHRAPATAPVRDALVAGMVEAFKAYQAIAARAAAQSDPLRATGDYLKSFAEERGVVPGVGEDEESVRARLFTAPAIVVPDAIRAGVNAILAPFTSSECQLSELDLDGWFVHDGTGTWDSFIGAEPDYPSRYYEDLPHRLPGGAVPSWSYPRSFLLRVPSVDTADSTISYALEGAGGIFVGDGSDASGSESSGAIGFSIFVDPRRADEIYTTIIGFVESVKGHGVSWSMVIDTSL